jgi:hypothetical protein
MQSDRFATLFEYLRKVDGQILLFNLVRDEVLNGYSRDFQDKVSATWNKIRPTLVDPDVLPPTPQLAPQLDALRKILHFSETIKVVPINGYTDMDIAEVVRRGIERIPPASSKGEELRDVILWLGILAHAKNSKKATAFITNDLGFWQKDADKPLDQISRDIAATGVDIQLYRGIESFLAANALEHKPVGAAWALDIFRRANLGDSLLQRVMATDYPAASVISQSLTAVQFDSGSLYQIGGASHFAELSYKASFELHTRTMRMAIPAVSGQIFIPGQVPLTDFINSPTLPNSAVTFSLSTFRTNPPGSFRLKPIPPPFGCQARMHRL